MTAAFLHFFFLASFCWVLTEAWQSYLAVIGKTRSRIIRKRFLCLGWGEQSHKHNCIFDHVVQQSLLLQPLIHETFIALGTDKQSVTDTIQFGFSVHSYCIFTLLLQYQFTLCAFCHIETDKVEGKNNYFACFIVVFLLVLAWTSVCNKHH